MATCIFAETILKCFAGVLDTSVFISEMAPESNPKQIESGSKTEHSH